MFIKEYGLKNPAKIFEDAGLPISIVGQQRINNCSKRWRKQYNERSSLEDTRKGNSGRPITRNLTLEEIIDKQKSQIEPLKQDAEILRQIRSLERRYQPKQSPSKKNTK